MAESPKTLRRRVRSVKNIGKITRAMEMVSAAKLRRAQSALMAARPFATKLREMLANVAEGSALAEHPLFAKREARRKILVLFTSDRGLAGSFNTNLIKQAEALLRSEPRTQWQLLLVGRKGRDYFQRRQWPILETITGLKGAAGLAEARQVGELLLQRFMAGETDAVLLLYPQFISTVVNRPVVTQYLPIDPEMFEGAAAREPGGRIMGAGTGAGEGNGAGRDYLFDPGPREVFESLLPRFLTSRIFITMAEMATSEHSARMVAMNNATRNCNEMADSLTLKMNKARQALITKELLEIVAGAEALKAG